MAKNPNIKIPLPKPDDLLEIIKKLLKTKPKTVTEVAPYVSKSPKSLGANTSGPPTQGKRIQISSGTSGGKYTSRTYDKGSPEYKKILATQRRDAAVMKKINKPSSRASSKKRSVEYNEARAAEKRIDVTGRMSSPDQYSKDAAMVRKFKNGKR